MKNVEDIYPLSPMQQGMLFHTIYAPDEGVYTEQLMCTLMGGLNIPALKQSLQRAVDRHPALRTCFLWEDLDEPLQIVRDHATLPLREYDWREVHEDEREERLQDFLKTDRERGFDISRAPLLRATLIHLATTTYKFVFTYHHMLLDGWSVGLLFREVFASYQASCAGRKPEPGPSYPYSDYVAWLQQQDMRHAEIFWRKELKGFKAPTPLGIVRTDYHASRKAPAYAEEQIELSLAATLALQSFARSNRLTLSDLLKGAWAILLSRYSGESDVVFGMTVSGRPTDLKDAESIIGLFINTLPVRVTVSRELPLLRYLRGLQEQQFELQPFEHSPLVQIRGWSQVPGNLPLFESIFVFENHPLENPLLGQDGTAAFLQISEVESQGRIDYPLTLLATPRDGLVLRVSYDTGRSNQQIIKLLLEHWKNLLEGFVANPLGSIGDLPMVTGEEREQILDRWNLPEQLRAPSTLHQLFQARAKESPDAIAVVCQDRELSFSELNSRANQLAHLLKLRGIGPERLVAICLDRSPELVVAILATLKAGGAYLPLDPNYPQQRLSFMLNDSQTEVIITTSELVDRLGSHNAQVICLDQESAVIAQQRGDNPESSSEPENLAYLSYTSGSTGQPKAVMITHHNVARLFAATEADFNFGPSDVWTMFHSYAFDFSVWEMWGALLYGGRLLVVPYWLSRNPEAFYRLVAEAKVTVLNQTPSAFRQFMRVDEERAAQLSLRVVVFGGEALDLGSLRGWVEKHGANEPQLINMYGITETTVHATYRRLSAAEIEQAAGSVIGRGIADLQVYVLDGQQQLCGVGVRGELYVGGDGLARGYAQRGELTAERFIPNPFSEEPGQRFYRSGDEGKYLPNGDIEYLGRKDHQVKIRGFRIETEEIEAVLREHPDVSETVVGAREDTNGEKFLVAYLLSHPRVQPNKSDLRSWLQARLPDYMVPARFVILDALPLTPSGKIDRRSLPEPDGSRPDLDQQFVAPRTPIEEELAQIWRALLGVQQVGIHDNFFELGGHSLLLTQLASRISEAFQIKLPLRVLFDAPSIEEMTFAIAETLTEQEDEQDVADILGELCLLSPDEAASLLEAEG